MVDDTWHTNPETHKQYQVVSTTDSKGRTGDYHVYADGSSVFVPKPDRPVDTVHGGVPAPTPPPPPAPTPSPAPAPAAPPAADPTPPPAPAAPAAPASQPAQDLAPNGQPWLTSADGNHPGNKYYVGPWDKDSQGRPGVWHVYQDASIKPVFLPTPPHDQTGGTAAPDESALPPQPTVLSQAAQPTTSGPNPTPAPPASSPAGSVPVVAEAITPQMSAAATQAGQAANEIKYTVVAGDTYWDLENKNGWLHGTLQALNPGTDPHKLPVGGAINIPSPQGSANQASAVADIPKAPAYPMLDHKEKKTDQSAEGGWGSTGGVPYDPTHQAMQATDASHHDKKKLSGGGDTIVSSPVG